MLEKAMKYFHSLAKPVTINEKGRNFSTVDLKVIPNEEPVVALDISSLDGLIDYVRSQFDTDRKLMIQVKSPKEVHVFDALDFTNDRRYYLKATAKLPKIQFGEFVDREKFQIMLQSTFCKTDGKVELLQLVSKMAIHNGVGVEDTGVIQQVTIKQGLDYTYKNAPERIELAPYRTFVELDQPISEFIFRAKETASGGISCGLFEADGGTWELTAMNSANGYLSKELSAEIGTGNVIIIS